MNKENKRSEQDVDFCEECGRVVRDGAPHDKQKHLALPFGTMQYDQVEIFQRD